MEEFRSPALIASCRLPVKGSHLTIKSKPIRIKRRLLSRPVGRSCLSHGKKLCRYTSWDRRSSRVSWKIPVHGENDMVVSTKERMGKKGETRRSANTGNDTWYSKEEYKKILLDQCLTVHIMRSLRVLPSKKEEGAAFDDSDGSGSNSNATSSDEKLMKKLAKDSKEYCERGLESYQTEECRTMINLNRKRHKLSVIGEHNRQGMVGTKDPELVRSISIAQSKKSLFKAQLLAALDQQEARASSSSTKDGNGEKEEHALEQQQRPRPLDSLGSQKHSFGKNTTDPSPPYNPGAKNSVAQPFSQNDTHFVPQSLRHDFFKHQQQQYRDFLFKYQQEQRHRDLLLEQQQQHAQSQFYYHPQQHNNNDFLNRQQPNTAYTKIEASTMLTTLQEQQLFCRNHHYQHQQLCYQEHMQRLLHSQQQQQLRVIGLATAALVDKPPR